LSIFLVPMERGNRILTVLIGVSSAIVVSHGVRLLLASSASGAAN
jgi:hypothetical protein